MAADDLTRPLGLDGRKAPGTRRRAIRLAAAGITVIGVMAVLWFGLARDPETGGPAVVATIEGGPVPSAKQATPAPDKSTDTKSPPPDSEGGDIGLIELTPDGGISDVGSDVIIISNPDDVAPMTLAAAPIEALTEKAPAGLLPRIGPDGTRPVDAYARPLSADMAGAPRQVAIVVGGIGIAADGTDAAIARLPGAITLAIAPYGKDLPRIIARARAAGHEILLQVPLEPYGYPNNDPGPQTLTVSASPDENIDRLHWLMSRITTYVGVANYLGARFTSDAAALTPVIEEIGKRGLLYFDDGTSGTSRAGQLARGRTPYARADMVIDAVTEPGAIDARLDQIAAIARQRGYAIAAASAFPVTIDRIAEFAKSAEKRGIEIVPVTALVDKDRS